MYPLVLIDYSSLDEEYALILWILVDLTPGRGIDGGDLFKVFELSKQKL